MEQVASSTSGKLIAWHASGGALNSRLPATAQGADSSLQSATLTRSVQTCYSIDGEEAALASAAGTNYGTGCRFGGSPVTGLEMTSKVRTCNSASC